MDISGISALLYSTHMMLASITKAQEFALDEKEAKILGEAIANVSKHYDTGVVSQRTLDWWTLGQTAAIVYGPRIFTARQKAADAKERRRKEQEFAQAAQPNGQAPGEPENYAPVSVAIM